MSPLDQPFVNGEPPSNEPRLTRKEFFGRLVRVGAGASLAAGALLTACGKAKAEAPLLPVLAGKSEIPEGESKTVAHPKEGYPVLIICTAPNIYVAYKRVCSHMSCPVNWVKELGKIVCPCHGGQYDVKDGSVISGPPKRGLDKVAVQVQGENVCLATS